MANSKDESIDKTQRNEELIKRCVAAGQDALIVKVADTIDSFKYYTSVNNDNQLQNYCLVITDLVFKYLPSDFNDKIFGELKLWQSKFTK